MLQRGEAKVLITDRKCPAITEHALPMLEERPLVIDIDDPQRTGCKLLGEMDYEAFLLEGDSNFEWSLPADEWDAIALNYTSGTTGNPKGVVYHDRDAYLNAVSNIISSGIPNHTVYLWTLPMFHCNGWCTPWTMAANSGTNVCLSRVEVTAIYSAIKTHKVTRFCAAPIVHSMLIAAPQELRNGIKHKVSGFITGAAPPAAVIEGMERIGFDITHVYGMTETYGLIGAFRINPEFKHPARAVEGTRDYSLSLELTWISTIDENYALVAVVGDCRLDRKRFKFGVCLVEKRTETFEHGLSLSSSPAWHAEARPAWSHQSTIVPSSRTAF